MVMDVMGSHKFSPLRWEIRCGKQILHPPFSPIRCLGFWRTCIKNTDVPTRAVCSLPSSLVRTNRKMGQNNKRPKPTIKAEGYNKKYNVSSKLVFMRNSPSPWSVVSSGNYHASLLSQACLIAVFGWLLFSNRRLIRALQIGYGNYEGWCMLLQISIISLVILLAVIIPQDQHILHKKLQWFLAGSSSSVIL